MSFESYAKWWIKTREKTENLKRQDEDVVMKQKKPKSSRKLANALVGGLYARYCMLVQELDTCLDQMCQPQKRIIVHKIVDAAVMRLKELKEALVEIDLSEYHYIDGNLVELKLVPKDIEILHPTLFFHRPHEIEELWDRVQKGERIYIPPPKIKKNEEGEEISPEEEKDKPVEVEEAPPETEVKRGRRKPARVSSEKIVIEEPVLTEEEMEILRKQQIITSAICMIQSHERARQSRLYYDEFDSIRQMRRRAEAGEKPKTEKFDEEFVEDMAVEVQRVWRGHTVRSMVKRKERERRLMIGMNEPSFKTRCEFEKLQRTMETRREYRDQKIKEYITANLEEKDRVLRVIAPGLMEDIGDEIREYFYQFYTRAKAFDEYPTVEQGGSILIVRAETLTPEKWLVEQEKKKAAQKDSKDAKKDKAKEKEKRKKEKAAEKKRLKKLKIQMKKEAADKKKREMQGEFDYTLVQSPFMDNFNAGFKEYKRIWDNIDYAENPTETHYMDMINEEKCYEMQLEVRVVVDELMRIELDLLLDALEEDKWKAKGKKGKAPKRKKKKEKKPKKQKKKKELTGNRTIEDLFQELVDNGIIRTHPVVRLEEYKGDFSYQNLERRNLDFDPPCTLGDVRQAVCLNCILPLGVETMVRPKSVLIAGARQSGKHLLANAIFTETRCVLFDLSPPILAGKYPGGKGMKLLVFLINKMARLLQPSIIFFDGAEKPFYKKVPPEEVELEPKKMGKTLFKGIVKTIKPVDRVLVLGITSKPFAASAGPFKKAYEKVILIPTPDYGSVYMYWRELLMPYHGLDRNFNCTVLAEITKGYPFSELKKAVTTVLTPARLIQLSYKPLTQAELYEAILTSEFPDPIGDKEWTPFVKWYKKYPGPKMKSVLMQLAEERREAEKALAAKKKK